MVTASLSHEMRTPIYAILAHLEDLEMCLKNRSNYDPRTMIRVIKTSAQMLLYLVNDMLDMYMLKNGKFQTISETFLLDEVLSHMRDMFQLQMTGQNINFTINVAKHVPKEFKSDERRLSQVLINLLSNALKFTRFGEIGIEVSFDKSSRLLTFEVKDTGTGIRKVDQIKLF